MLCRGTHCLACWLRYSHAGYWCTLQMCLQKALTHSSKVQSMLSGATSFIIYVLCIASSLLSFAAAAPSKPRLHWAEVNPKPRLKRSPDE